MNEKRKKARRIHAGWARAISRTRRVHAIANSSVGYRWGPRRGKLVGALVGSSVSGGGQRSSRTPASRAISAASLRSRAEEDIPGKDQRRRRRRRRGNDGAAREKTGFFFSPPRAKRPSRTRGKYIPFLCHAKKCGKKSDRPAIGAGGRRTGMERRQQRRRRDSTSFQG